jgi:hypothetical protein
MVRMLKVNPPNWLGRRLPAGTGAVPSGGGAPSAAAQPRQLDALELPSGIVPYTFGINNLGASATATQLYRMMPGSAATFAQVGILAMFAGEVVGLGVHSNAAKSAGSASLEVWSTPPGGVAAALGAILAWKNASHDMTVFPRNRYAFASGAVLDIRATTDSSYLPTTADLEVVLYIAQRTRH